MKEIAAEYAYARFPSLTNRGSGPPADRGGGCGNVEWGLVAGEVETGATFAPQDLEPGFGLEPHGLARGAALPVTRRVARMGRRN